MAATSPAEVGRGGGYRKSMSFYKRTKREKRDETLNLRVTASLKQSLGRLDRAWAFLDSLDDDAPPFDPDEKANESAVAVRLLEESIANAWKEIGSFEPKTDEQWDLFYETARATHEKHKKGAGQK